MNRINLNNWYINNNSLSISLLKFYIKIKPINNYYQLIITDNKQDTITLNFINLEEAIYFTENTINKCNSIEEILEQYELYIKKNIDNKILFLNPKEIENAIKNYYNKITATYELSIKNGKPNITFFIIENPNTKYKRKIQLTEADLTNVLKEYIEKLNYELISYKYIGGIHKTGYYIDEDTPYYEGVEVYIKEKKKYILTKK